MAGPADDTLPPDIESFAFTDENAALVQKILARYPEGRQASAVLPLLDLAQRQMAAETGSAWLPRKAMDRVAALLGMAPIRVYEVATFYTMFNLRPIGRFHLQVCTTTPCWLRGSDEVAATCKRVTGADWGRTSPDGRFHMTEVECLGACVNAPMLQVNDDFHEDLDGPATERLLEALKRGEVPPAGSARGRQASAPEGGLTSLTTIHGEGAGNTPPAGE